MAVSHVRKRCGPSGPDGSRGAYHTKASSRTYHAKLSCVK
jgi:hypothetical protein